ncbi:hypothetical protein J2W22_002875 [Sphingomonas kyeonggiensis]|uniref:DnaT-like ssDNA-binding protein n=1 Tax=Sphingomonas kyeonggiensis TaxID=1268553 RepID=UPI002781D6D0|nr:DnaT-like ssDNA-binding protein [Sphingomonas kyeonggiensis]MDQ0250811.1 hypothetical protein [Sphingomonas kyeonggiensis]
MILPTPGTNSYVSLDAANALASGRLFTAAWTAATGDTRAQALMTATALLDRMQWQGRRLAPTQPLAWPRVADRCPEGFPLTADIPTPIAAATVELAIFLLGNGELPGGPAIMQRMLGDSMVMHFAHVADELPKHVRRLIEPFLRVSSANVAEVRF